MYFISSCKYRNKLVYRVVENKVLTFRTLVLRQSKILFPFHLINTKLWGFIKVDVITWNNDSFADWHILRETSHRHSCLEVQQWPDAFISQQVSFIDVQANHFTGCKSFRIMFILKVFNEFDESFKSNAVICQYNISN